MVVKGFKFKIVNQDNSRDIQNALFKLDYKWAGNDAESVNILHLKKLYIYADYRTHKMTYGINGTNFNNSSFIEMKVLQDAQVKMIKDLLFVTLESKRDDSINPIWIILEYGNELLNNVLKSGLYNIEEDTTYLNGIRERVVKFDGKYIR